MMKPSLLFRWIKSQLSLSKPTLIFFLFLTYLLPLSVFVYGATLKYTLPLLVGGGLLLAWLLHLWEKKLQGAVRVLVKAKFEQAQADHLSIETHKQQILQQQMELKEQRRFFEHQVDLLQSSAWKSKERSNELAQRLEKKSEEIREIERQLESMRREKERTLEEFSQLRREGEEQLDQKERLLSEYTQTLYEQRQVIEKKQHYIHHLEAKIEGMREEIHHLVQLEPLPSPLPLAPLASPSPILPAPSPFLSLSHHLRRYIGLAEELMGVEHFGYRGGLSPRFLDREEGGYFLDLRPLFEIFNDEETYIPFVYSPGEGKFLFIHHLVKRALGWSPEKFAHHFPSLISKSYAEWRKGISSLGSGEECRLQLLVQNRREEEVSINCVCGKIEKGPFMGHLIGLMI